MHVNSGNLGSFDAYSPQQALRWVRISLMMIAIALDEEPYRQAQHRNNHEPPQTLQALRQGEPQDLTLKAAPRADLDRPTGYLPAPG